MKFAHVYVYFRLVAGLSAVVPSLYPCQYVDSSDRRLKCDLCQCLSSPSWIDSSANLCAWSSSIACANQSNEQWLRAHVDRLTPNSLQVKNQLEFHHFNDDLLHHEELCSAWNHSQLTFFYLLSNRSSPSPPSSCFFIIDSLRFVNSHLDNNQLFSQRNLLTLIFFNSTLNIHQLNSTSIETLIFSSVQFDRQPLQLQSLPSLISLTLTYTTDFSLIGSFPHLSYLNLCHTNLNDKHLARLLAQISVPDLTTMILSHNQLTNIANRFPSSIRHLDLSFNQIKSLDYYSFKSLYSLNVLNLSSNSPLEIQQDTFTRVPYLEILDLSSCLPTLPLDELFLPLQKLRHLNVSANHLESLPQLPSLHDAHAMDSYDHDLPVLHVDLSKNSFNEINLEIFFSSSMQDKYVLSMNLTRNHLRTLTLPSALLNDTRRRGPFIELDIADNPLECDCQLYENMVNVLKYDAALPISATTPVDAFLKRARIKLLHLANLTCLDTIERSRRRSLVDLHPSTSFCPYTKVCPSTCQCCSSFVSDNDCHCALQCPRQCSCQHSADRTINHVNCSSRQLTDIPRHLPHSTTHLYLDHNHIKRIGRNLTHLTKLRFLILAKNQLEHLNEEEFVGMEHLKHLDLSFNAIEHIAVRTFASMPNLEKVYLHRNPWIPKFYYDNQEFQSNTRLVLLTYAHELYCNRTTIGRPLSADECCQFAQSESCHQVALINETSLKHDETLVSYVTSDFKASQAFLSSMFPEQYRLHILAGLSASLFFLICCVTFYTYRRRRSSNSHKKFLSKNNARDKTAHYDKPLIPARHRNLDSQTAYSHSLSLTDEDDYAFIPLTISQTDLPTSFRSPSDIPPLPPPRHLLSHRPISHSSTVSTSITNQSLTSPSRTALIPPRSCLQIKLDVLVLYSITDSKYIHESLAENLEVTYGKRFSFYFIHRDRMLGDLDWLIRNSCVILLLVKKPYHLVSDYMKIISVHSAMKYFIIVMNTEQARGTVSLKHREKIARLYRTSEIYEWNADANSLVHEQLELFLERNCGSATYVTD